MIIENQAKDNEVAHKVEILCPHCGRDVDETELAAQLCNDCGTSLEKPKQSVTIAATSISAFAVTF